MTCGVESRQKFVEILSDRQYVSCR